LFPLFCFRITKTAHHKFWLVTKWHGSTPWFIGPTGINHTTRP